MGKPTRQNSGTDRLKRQKRPGKPQTTGNKRLAEQIRKILGKHYASTIETRQSTACRLTAYM